MLSTQPKVGVVAGSSRGIGKACARCLLDRGWIIGGIARSQQVPLAANMMCAIADLTKDSDAERAIAEIYESFGRIDAVIHCVGDIGEGESIANTAWERWVSSYDLCVGSFVRILRWTFRHVADTAGAYVAISSVAAKKPYPGIADYCAAKAALSSVVRSAAMELASTRGRANSISPAVVDTDLFRRGPYSESEAASWHKLGRIGKPEEVAELAAYLAGPESAWITGRDFVMDGGMLL